MAVLSEESRKELDALRAEIRGELGAKGRHMDKERLETERVRRLALVKAGRLVVEEMTNKSRFFASRAGRVWHPNARCPSLAVCQPEEIIHVVRPWESSLADRDCERCSVWQLPIHEGL